MKIVRPEETGAQPPAVREIQRRYFGISRIVIDNFGMAAFQNACRHGLQQ